MFRLNEHIANSVYRWKRTTEQSIMIDEHNPYNVKQNCTSGIDFIGT